jgi:vacuolar-type H+-ATPase subunit I/STV1
MIFLSIDSNLLSYSFCYRTSFRYGSNPFGRILNTNEFSKDFFTTFKANTVGKFTLTILNQGSNPVNVDGFFGYMPFVGENNQVNLSSLNSLLIGISLFIIGIIVMIVGIVFTIIDKKRENRRPPPSTR